MKIHFNFLEQLHLRSYFSISVRSKYVYLFYGCKTGLNKNAHEYCGYSQSISYKYGFTSSKRIFLNVGCNTVVFESDVSFTLKIKTPRLIITHAGSS